MWRTLPQYGPATTLLLDNEARKFGDAPRIGIVVPEFGPAEALSRRGGTLDTLVDYLLRCGPGLRGATRGRLTRCS